MSVVGFVEERCVNLPAYPIGDCEIRPQLILILSVAVVLLRACFNDAAASLKIVVWDSQQEVSAGISCAEDAIVAEAKVAIVVAGERVGHTKTARVKPEFHGV